MIKKQKPYKRLKEKVKTAKKRKISSTRWLQRQLNDPYVKKSKSEGRRSRAAYKIEEINQKFKIFRGGMSIIDLGSAPGSWSQYVLNNYKNCKNGRTSFNRNCIRYDCSHTCWSFCCCLFTV